MQRKNLNAEKRRKCSPQIIKCKCREKNRNAPKKNVNTDKKKDVNTEKVNVNADKK